MSRYAKQAIAVIGAADIAIQTIAKSFELGADYQTKLTIAHLSLMDAAFQWPGPKGDVREGAWSAEKLKAWSVTVKRDIRLGRWVMNTLAAVALQAITDLYERPSTRLQRPLLDPLFPILQAVHDTVEGGIASSYESNKLAGEMLAELYRLVGLEEVRVVWLWERAA